MAFLVAARSVVGEWLSLVEHLVRDQGVGGHQSFEQTQIADQKSSEGAGEDTVDYVDTSAYEVYEKQEGDFVEPDAEPAVEANAAAAGEEDSVAETPHKQ